MSKRFVLVVIALVTTGVAAAKWLQVGAPAPTAQVRVTEQSSQGVTFEVTVPGIEVSAERRDGRDFSRVTFPGGQPAPLTIGRPEVPMIPVLLAVPTGARVIVHLVSIETQELQVTSVLPLQPLPAVGYQPGEFVFDQAYYAQDESYPATDAAVRLTAGWHDLGVASIHVYPVQANSGRGMMKVASRMVIRAEFSGGAYPQTVTGWMIPMYSRLVANWSELNLPPAKDDPDATKLLVICDEFWYNNAELLKLLAWTNERGFKVQMERISGLPQHDPDYIKAKIADVYSTSGHELRWVLLVGEFGTGAGQLPMKLLPSPYYPYRPDEEPQYRYGDFWYTDLDDEVLDYFPEVGIGRLSVTDPADLSNQATKILGYQTAPGRPYDWLSTAQLVAHKQADHDFLRYMQRVQNPEETPLNFFDFNRPLIDGQTQGNAALTTAVNAGVGVLMYFGHGTHEGWAEWGTEGDWLGRHINDLDNSAKTPVVWQTSCSCAELSWPECITESWMRKADGGAVACFGGFHIMYYDFQYPDAADPLKDLLYAIGDNTHSQSGGGNTYPDPVFNLGDAQMYTEARFANIGDLPRLVCELSMICLGDPSMPIWSGGAPSIPLVTYPHSIPVLPSDVDVTVKADGMPVENAIVCLSKSPDVYVTGKTGAQGVATLPVPAHTPGDILVTVSEGHANESQQGAPHTPILPFTSGTWYECAQVPTSPSGEAVRDGGWLDFDASGASGNGLIYAAKGKKQPDFYRYDRYGSVNSEWLEREPIPPGTEGRPPYKGCRGVCDGNGHVYMTKGNNTLGFWRYDAADNTWHQLAPVLEGTPRRRVKGGTDLVFTREFEDNEWHAYVYLLKGGNNEFHRYDSATGVWTALAPAPANSSIKYKAGSFLAYDGNQYIYAHQAKEHKLYRYDTQGEPPSWSGDLGGMPFVNGQGRSKKSKDGGCGIWMDGCIWALKGGNTQEFWQYDAATRAWAEMETIPSLGSTGKQRKVKAGGDITNAGGTLFAFKGNKTLEMWRCAPGIRSLPEQMGGFAASPSPAKDDPPPPEYPLLEGEPGCQPRWNPQGGWVTYTKEPVQGQSFEQVFMAPYGLQQFEVQLTDLPGDCESPSFSPGSGEWICFAVLDSSTDRLQIAKVPATSIPQPVVMLTSGNQDKWNPEWSPSGQAIIAQGDDAGGSYSQLWLIPADSGPAAMLTSGPCDREEPSYLNATEILYLRSPDNGDDQLYKLNLVTMQESPLTSPPLQPERPCPSYDGSFACYQAQDDAGIYQIGRVSSIAGGAHFLTGDVFDQEEPDASPDNVSIHSVRWVGLTSQICRVDAVNGGFVPITDANAIRDNPDSYWNPSLPYNLVVYEREDTSTAALGFGLRPKPKHRRGTGVFLARSQRPGDGQMAAGLYVLALDRAEPNPATNRVKIRWQVPVEANVSLRVYNTAGQLVKVLAQGEVKPGRYTTTWAGTDQQGRRLAAGICFCALDTGDKRLTRKVVLAE
jgi:hypothetical protein